MPGRRPCTCCPVRGPPSSRATTCSRGSGRCRPPPARRCARSSFGSRLRPAVAPSPGPPCSPRMKLLLVPLAAGVYAGAPPVYLLPRARAAIVAGDDLLTRQRALQAAAGKALRDIVLWLALGALCAPLEPKDD